MTPRSGKGRRRGKYPMPILIPLPRPCLRSLNVPGRYYMPVPPHMLLPWAYPPPYLLKPICHCTHEDFCNANDCRNSAECLKVNPIYFPHSNKEEEGLDTQQYPNREAEGSYTDGGTSVHPKTGVCSACGGKWVMDGTSELQDTIPFKSDVRLEDDSYASHKQSGVNHVDDTSLRKNTFVVKGKSVAPQERGSDVAHRPNSFLDGNKTAESSLSERPLDSRSDSSSQTADRVPTGLRGSTKQKSKYVSPKRISKPTPQSSLNYEEDSESFHHNSISPSSYTRRLNNLNRDTGSDNCSVESNVPDSENNPVAKSLDTREEISVRRPTQNLQFNKPPGQRHSQIDELSEHVSQSRKNQKSKNNSCCTSTTRLLKKCKVQIPDQGELHKSSSKSLKLSECGCSTKKFSTKKSLRGMNQDIFRHDSLRIPKCQCKFPPVYRHLSCNADPTDGCDCTNMPLQ